MAYEIPDSVTNFNIVPQNSLGETVSRRRFIYLVAASIAGLGLTASSCEEPSSTAEEIKRDEQMTLDEQRAIMESRGLLGRLKLSQVRPVSETTTESNASGSLSGDLDAFFLLVAGAVNGEVEGRYESSETTVTERKIRVAWLNNSNTPFITYSEFPVGKIQVYPEEGLKEPEIDFNLNPQSFAYLGDSEDGMCWYDSPISDNKQPGYQPYLCMRAFDDPNLNNWLGKLGAVTTVAVYINPEDAMVLNKLILELD